MLLLSIAGGLTWSVVQSFPGRFDKLAVMAPFPDMASDALTPATVIGELNPATGEPFQPPADSLIIDVRTQTTCTSLAAQAPRTITRTESLQRKCIINTAALLQGTCAVHPRHPQIVAEQSRLHFVNAGWAGRAGPGIPHHCQHRQTAGDTAAAAALHNLSVSVWNAHGLSGMLMPW